MMCVCVSELVWPSWNDSLRAMSNSFSLSLPFALSLSRVQICAMLFWRVNLVSFISIGIREGEGRRRRRRCVFLCEWERERGARSISSNETIVVLHTKLSCCFYWCYSLVTMRDVTPRQLCQCARLYTYMRNDVYTWTSISHTFWEVGKHIGSSNYYHLSFFIIDQLMYLNKWPD